jgi:hypothetical protein
MELLESRAVRPRQPGYRLDAQVSRNNRFLYGRYIKRSDDVFYGVTIMLSETDSDWAPAPLVDPVTVTE